MSITAEDLLQRHRLTVADFQRMGQVGILREDSRIELIEGELIDKTPIGSRHAGVVMHLSRLLNKAVGEAAIVSVQGPLVLGDLSAPEPDIALLRVRQDFYKSTHPRATDVLLIIEVADSSLRFDREVKIPLYARHGIPEVWLVDVENDQLSLFRSPGSQGYEGVERPDSLSGITPKLLPDIALDLTGLF